MSLVFRYRFSVVPGSIKGVQFDCDGTLVDTEPLCADVTRQVVTRYGIETTDEELQLLTGVTAEKFFRMLLAKNRQEQHFEEIMRVHAREYEGQLESGLLVLPGARELPKELLERGYALSLVSGSTRRQIEIIMGVLGLSEIFAKRVVWEDVGTRSKPDPHGYLLGATVLGLSPEECIVLEDSEPGIRAALAAGMPVIGVTNGREPDWKTAPTNTVGSLEALRGVSPEDWVSIRQAASHH